MEIKMNRVLILVFGFFTIFSSCMQKEIDDEKLCTKFFELNKGKSFDILYDVAIGGRRGKSIYDKSTNKYEYTFNTIDVYDAKSDEFLMLPIYRKNATLAEKDSVQENLSEKVKNYLLIKYGIDSKISKSYIKYIDKLLIQYYNIEIPNELGFKNVVIEGHPRSGEFITFTLNDTCKVYYLKDNSEVSDYWKSNYSGG